MTPCSLPRVLSYLASRFQFRGRWYVVVILLAVSGQLLCWTTEAYTHLQDHHHHHHNDDDHDDDNIFPLISFLQGPHNDQGKDHYNRLASITEGRKSPGEERAGEVVKRVFLSRGWGPGGYDAPPPPPPSPPHRFVRRPPAPPRSSPAPAGTTTIDRTPSPKPLVVGKTNKLH